MYIFVHTQPIEFLTDVFLLPLNDPPPDTITYDLNPFPHSYYEILVESTEFNNNSYLPVIQEEFVDFI